MDKCSCEHCYNEVVAKGLCGTHYKRLQRHGNVSQTRPSDWGQRDKHPLYNSWAWIRKMRGRHYIQESWEDFWAFVSDVGERPTEQHQLRKITEENGYTKDNLVWKEVVSSKDKNAYAKEWRKRNPDKAKNSDLKRMFGITLQEYNSMLERQGNTCAICKNPETDENISLSVDHCHTSGKVRGLLCSNCNRGLGLFRDLVGNLENAIKYLEENK